MKDLKVGQVVLVKAVVIRSCEDRYVRLKTENEDFFYAHPQDILTTTDEVLEVWPGEDMGDKK